VEEYNVKITGTTELELDDRDDKVYDSQSGSESDKYQRHEPAEPTGEAVSRVFLS
jgi:hypothetical protein